MPDDIPFGDYVLESQLGKGGMAVTWKARERVGDVTERRVAIKQILPEHASDPDFRAMFFDEVRISALINHRNVCRVHRAGEVDGALFMAMDWIDGWSLSDIQMRHRQLERPLPISHTVFLIIEVLRGLQAAHELVDPDGQQLEVVHRDVSPQNVMIARGGDVKLIDFGIAKATTSQVETRSGYLKGKVIYMSPEQLQGEPLDARSDLFSTGLMLYELLTGAHPLRGESDAATVYNYIVRAIEPPSRLRPGIAPQLDEAIMRSLDGVESRYETAGRMARALSDALDVQAPHYRGHADLRDWVREKVTPAMAGDHLGVVIDPGWGGADPEAQTAGVVESAADDSVATGPTQPIDAITGASVDDALGYQQTAPARQRPDDGAGAPEEKPIGEKVSTAGQEVRGGRDPRTDAEPETPPSHSAPAPPQSTTRWPWFVGGGLLIALVAGGVVWQLIGAPVGGEDATEDPAAAENEEPGDSRSKSNPATDDSSTNTAVKSRTNDGGAMTGDPSDDTDGAAARVRAAMVQGVTSAGLVGHLGAELSHTGARLGLFARHAACLSTLTHQVRRVGSSLRTMGEAAVPECSQAPRGVSIEDAIAALNRHEQYCTTAFLLDGARPSEVDERLRRVHRDVSDLVARFDAVQTLVVERKKHWRTHGTGSGCETAKRLHTRLGDDVETYESLLPQRYDRVRHARSGLARRYVAGLETLGLAQSRRIEIALRRTMLSIEEMYSWLPTLGNGLLPAPGMNHAPRAAPLARRVADVQASVADLDKACERDDLSDTGRRVCRGIGPNIELLERNMGKMHRQLTRYRQIDGTMVWHAFYAGQSLVGRVSEVLEPVSVPVPAY